MRKIISIFLSVVLLFGVLATGVYAASPNNEIMPYYVAVTGWSATLDKTSSTTAKCHSRFSTHGDYLIVATMYLKRKEGTLWKTAGTWSNSGTTVVTVNGSTGVATGYEYMVYSVADIYDENGNFVERATVSSNTVSY